MFKDPLFSERNVIFSLIVILFIWIISAFIAIYASNNLLEQFNTLKLWTSIQASILPIDRWSEKSSFYQVTLTCNSILIYTTPFYIMIFWRYLKTRKRGLIKKTKLTIKDRFVLLIVFIFMATAFLAFWFLFDSRDTRLFKLASSRFDLALYGGAVFGWISFFLTSTVSVAIRLFKK